MTAFSGYLVGRALHTAWFGTWLYKDFYNIVLTVEGCH